MARERPDRGNMLERGQREAICQREAIGQREAIIIIIIIYLFTVGRYI